MKTKISTIFFIMALLCPIISYAQPAGYGFGKQIIIQASEVSGSTDLTNFPVLISFTDSDLSTTVGNVTNTNGYDIVFTLDDCSTLLDHEIEFYDNTTGEYVAWVRIPTLSATNNTAIGMFYGNSSVSLDPSTNATWNSSYLGVYHLHDDVNDATANGNHATNNGSTDATGAASTGRMGDAQAFDGNNDYLQTPIDLATEDDITVSVWVNTNSTNESHIIWQGENNVNGWGTGAGNDHEFHLSTATCCPPPSGAPIPDNISFFMADREIEVEATEIIFTESAFTDVGNWHYFTGTISNISTSPDARLYIDNAEVDSDTDGGNGFVDRTNWNTNLRIGRPGLNQRYFDGELDEVRISTDAKSADWVITEYNNQRSGSTFYTVSAEMTAAISCGTLPIQLKSFDAQPEGYNRVKIDWQTSQEINNDYFTIERSQDAKTWTDVKNIAGAGNSNEILTYTDYDDNPFSGKSYYRLKQTDYDGTTSYSWTVSVELDAFKELHIYPVPATEELTVEIRNPQDFHVTFNNSISQQLDVSYQIKSNQLVFDVSDLSKGLYFITLQNGNRVITKKIIIE